MKKPLQFTSLLGLFVALFLFGCGTTSKVAAPEAPAPPKASAVPIYVGSWDYNLETPQGNMPGTMIVEQVGDLVKGRFASDMGSIEMENLKIESNQLTTRISVQGMEIDVSGTFKEKVFDGKMVVDGFEMPFQANKVEK